MADETKDVTAESSSALEGAIASSPEALNEQTPGTQNPTAEKGESQEQEVEQEEPRVPYSRLKEVVDEKNWFKSQLEQRMNQPNQQQPQQAPIDPYANMTAEEEKFFRMIDARAEKIAESKMRQISPVIDAGRMELAQMKVMQFRSAHPDVKANSAEEIAIAERIQSGYLPEDAYKVVMWDRKVEQAKQQGSAISKQKMEAKKQANVEQSSIPQGATAPTSKKMTLRQRIEASAKDLDF